MSMAAMFYAVSFVSLVIGVLIGYWIGTIPQRAAEAEKKAETARLRAIWVDAQRDLGFEDTSDWGTS